MNSESYEEKTEQPTRYKIKKSKELGILSYSRDLNSFFILLFSFFFFKIIGKKIFYFFYQCLVKSLIFNVHSLKNKIFPFTFLFFYIKFFIFYFFILYVVILFILIITPILFFNHSISIKPLKINIIFLNIMPSIKKIFSLNIFLEFFKTFLKIVFFVYILGYYLWHYYPSFMLFTKISLVFNILLGLRAINMCFIVILGLVFGMAILDFFWEHYQNNKNLRMTLQEIKNEFKELEGNPVIKQNIRYILRKKGRTKNNIFNADVIIIDQLQYAIAIQYNIDTMSAPKILLKSQGKSVKKIKELSKNYQIPVLLLPELTKVLYDNTVSGKDIPDFLYKPVAEIFAWVWQLRRWRKYGGIYPQPPKYISIPTEVYFIGE